VGRPCGEPRREHLLKIGVSGVRGVVGDFLTPAIATAFAQAFGTYVGGGPVVLGRDTRASGAMLVHAVTGGLLASGCEVVQVGVLPTPTIQIYVSAMGARGGLAVTASHNPPEYNALKLFNARGLFFNGYERAELIDLYHQRVFRESANAEIRAIVDAARLAPRIHLDRVLDLVGVSRIRSRRVRVALDAVNGAASVMSCAFLQDDLGCDLHAIGVDPSLPFSRDPEPRPDTLADLARLVVETGADIGFGQDPDGDRLAIVDETGRVLDNDDVLALAVESALRHLDGDVVVNLTTSSAIDDIARASGRRVHRTPVGEANVVEMMEAVGAAIGGEGGNGGVICRNVHLCRDSFTAMALVLDRIAASGLRVSELAAMLPRYVRRQGKVPFEHGRLGRLVQQLTEALPAAEADTSDGLKLTVPGGWVHVRASNTEPVLRIAAEAPERRVVDDLYERALTLASLE
jgi:phosphomannomutase